MRRLTTASLWLLAPTYAAWRSARPRASRPLEPFRRWNPKAMRWWVGSLVIGGAVIGLAFALEVPIVGVLGVGWAFAGAYKLAARLIVPKRWVSAEMDFMTLTSLTTVTRIGLWVGFFVKSRAGKLDGSPRVRRSSEWTNPHLDSHYTHGATNRCQEKNYRS